MSDPIERNTDNAILLLAAAEELGLPPEVVRSTTEGFEAPDEVVQKAFAHKSSSTDEPNKAPAKRAPAKKAPAKKAAAKTAAK